MSTLGKQTDHFDSVDIVRILCAFSVTLVHCQPMVSSMKPIIVSLTGFRTYFFVLVFFFFLSRDSSRITFNYLRNRVSQLGTPYLFWTLIYFSLRTISLTGLQRSYYLSSPVNILFFGNSGVQMYFIPMIITGLFLSVPLLFAMQNFKFKAIHIIYSLILSIIFRPDVTLMSFSNTPIAANHATVQVLYWSLWLVPFLLMGILLNTPYIRKFVETPPRLLKILIAIIFIATIIPVRHEISDRIAIFQSFSILFICLSNKYIHISRHLSFKIKNTSSLIFYSHPLYIESYQFLKRTIYHKITFNIIDIFITISIVFAVSIVILPFIERIPRIKHLIIGR